MLDTGTVHTGKAGKTEDKASITLYGDFHKRGKAMYVVDLWVELQVVQSS